MSELRSRLQAAAVYAEEISNEGRFDVELIVSPIGIKIMVADRNNELGDERLITFADLESARGNTLVLLINAAIAEFPKEN